jgi:hypothetical protein
MGVLRAVGAPRPAGPLRSPVRTASVVGCGIVIWLWSVVELPAVALVRDVEPAELPDGGDDLAPGLAEAGVRFLRTALGLHDPVACQPARLLLQLGGQLLKHELFA